MHENSFIELTFSLKDKSAYTNNFAAIVLISNRNCILTTLLPYNGSIWEQRIENAHEYFIK